MSPSDLEWSRFGARQRNRRGARLLTRAALALALVGLGALARNYYRDNATLQYLYAAKSEDRAKLWFLHWVGADVNARDGAGRTALMLLAQRGDARQVGLLLRAGADINAADALGGAALTYALQPSAPQRVVLASAPIARLLLERGAQVNVVSAQGDTPLALALAARQFDLARQFLARGADPNAGRVERLCAPLFWAVQNNQDAIARELLARGADPNAASAIGSDLTPLRLAEARQKTDLARVMRAQSARQPKIRLQTPPAK